MEPTEVVILGVPAVWYALGFGIALLLVNFFLKSIIIDIAIILCMVGVIAEAGGEGNDWLYAGALMVMIYAAISAFWIFNRWREG